MLRRVIGEAREGQKPSRSGADRDRTDDLKLAKLALSQLSYSPIDEPGGDERDRTDDLRIANAALSQLSYVPDVTT